MISQLLAMISHYKTHQPEEKQRFGAPATQSPTHGFSRLRGSGHLKHGTHRTGKVKQSIRTKALGRTAIVLIIFLMVFIRKFKAMVNLNKEIE